MKEVIFEDLIIEVTRRCNLRCDHCLRGEQEDIDIADVYYDTVFAKIDYIETLTLTGGEPSLVPYRIRRILNSLIHNKVEIGSFYIATNAYDIHDEFIRVLMDLYLYSNDRDMCRVDISNDYFHDNNFHESEKLMMFKFAGNKYKDSGHDYYNFQNIINEGFGSNVSIPGRSYNAHCLFVEEEDDMIKFHGEVIYLNAEGKILIGCDYSYESQRYNEICSYNEDILKELKEIIFKTQENEN